jgi:lipopolysaccharide/colanic/teichoic acid biosynthesis glycosyltransferase
MKIRINDLEEKDFINLKLPSSYLEIRRIVEVSFIILISPLIVILGALTAVLVYVYSGTPVIFKQIRSGRRGELFQIYKFRTLNSSKEMIVESHLEEKVTKIGKFLRKHRLDEIPQFWNVLKGNMSLIGPRPEPDFAHKKNLKNLPYYRYKLLVKPGLTGWAQVNFNHTENMDDAKYKMEYELFYIKNLSVLLDIKIILKTIYVMIFGKGSR